MKRVSPEYCLDLGLFRGDDDGVHIQRMVMNLVSFVSIPTVLLTSFPPSRQNQNLSNAVTSFTTSALKKRKMNRGVNAQNKKQLEDKLTNVVAKDTSLNPPTDLLALAQKVEDPPRRGHVRAVSHVR